jgi:hypothetical protein
MKPVANEDEFVGGAQIRAVRKGSMNRVDRHFTLTPPSGD